MNEEGGLGIYEMTNEELQVLVYNRAASFFHLRGIGC